ncbi:WAT1-related protein [Vigna angularis]|uniref:WAT1-related protein n=1 Tax=Phaseolus angularis TaxID=3914 RepID=A0A8T0JLI2_PHAAN|nr:WAT1-related protein [Vigna angularis]
MVSTFHSHVVIFYTEGENTENNITDIEEIEREREQRDKSNAERRRNDGDDYGSVFICGFEHSGESKPVSSGMSNFVFVAYSNLFGFCFLLTATTLRYRNRSPPPLNNSIVFRAFLLGFLGVFIQTLFYIGLGYGSPTLSSATEDLIPAFTFIIAVVFRMEKLDLKLRSSQAKTIGTVVSIAGALTVTLYKGK